MRVYYLLVVGVVLLLSSCDDGALYQEVREINSGVWNTDSVKRFNFEIDKKDARYDFFVDIRNSGDYPYSNIYLFFKLDFPNGKFSVDTIECFLSDPSGRWYGSGLGDVFDNRVLIKHDVSFPFNGPYSVSIEQAMREEELQGILNIGFRLAPAFE